MICRVMPLSGLLALAVLLRFPSQAFTAEATLVCERKGDVLHVHSGGPALEISLKAPVFLLGEVRTSGDIAPSKVEGELGGSQPIVVSYAPIPVGASMLEVKVSLQWSPEESVLRKWAQIRQAGGPDELVLKEVVLERIDPRGEALWTHGANLPGKRLLILDGPQSHPVFLPGRFVGIEYPVSCTCLEGQTLVLAHRPGVKLQPGDWYQTRKAVCGLTPMGKEVHAFQRYLQRHRPQPSGLHVNYNSWWTSPVPYAEKDILGLMQEFDARLFQAHQTGVDTFCIDMGWSNLHSIWQIDRQQFPEGFDRIRQAAEKMRAKLGLWISPSSCYPGALDPQWAQQQGFETIGRPKSYSILCLGGKKYADEFKTKLADLVRRYGISHLKFDGYVVECPEKDHGHEPGSYSAEAVADGIIAAAQAARRANPEVWIETTCFGYNPSPWWLFSMNSVIGSFGDDAPVGRVPSPVYRESYTTARDFFNLQGTALSPIPPSCQEVLGIIHQSADPLMNDAVVTVLRGHRFLPLYVNPKFMNPSRWKALAELLAWARNHAEILEQTTPLLPESWQKGSVPQFTDQGTMPREPYGYAHVKHNRALVALRNPWVAPQHYRLVLEGTLGLPPDAANLSAVSLYPEPRRYGTGLNCGDALDVALAPYETVVLAIGPNAGGKDLPPEPPPIGTQLEIVESMHRLERVAFRGTQQAFGPDWTSRLGDTSAAVRLTMDAKVQVKAPSAELLVLCEGNKSPSVYEESVLLNGRKREVAVASSAVGWRATGLPTHEHWTFTRVPLATGENRVSLAQFIGGDCTRVSAWLWATRPGGVSTVPEALPQPETISLDGAMVVAPAEITDLPAAAAPIELPVDRIDGVFLDALEPVSVLQGYGKLQKNQSVWEKPMTIAGKPYLRGLGTHAPSKIVYALDGKYRRFQAWAGADSATGPTVTFEVRLDGAKKWESALMTRDTPAARVDLDVTGVKTLELIVGDAGDIAADHANWAEARLLR